MPRDLYIYIKYRRWFERLGARVALERRLRKATRYRPFRRTGPASQWHSDSYRQPGEVE